MKKNVAIIGYGSQGHAHALNLRDGLEGVGVLQRLGYKIDIQTVTDYDITVEHGVVYGFRIHYGRRGRSRARRIERMLHHQLPVVRADDGFRYRSADAGRPSEGAGG